MGNAADISMASPGVLVDLEPGVQTVLAPNPSPMTGPGTNTYLLGQDELAVIDPGPDDPSHLRALLAAIGPRQVSHILVTHSHLDHSPLAAALAQEMHAPIYAFGDSKAGRSAVMTQLADAGMTGGGEGIDHSFAPDVTLADGDEVTGDGWTLQVMHTPGHLGNHLAFVWNDAVFVGDTVMGWSTSLVSPPDGDMAEFMASCHRLAGVQARILYSGHGAPITDPSGRLAALIAHRVARTDAILDALTGGPATVNDLVMRVYEDLAAQLVPAASRNVFAHLIALVQEGKVMADPSLTPDASFARNP